MKDDHVMVKSDSKLLLRQTIRIVSFSLLTFLNMHLPLIVLNSDTLFGVQVVICCMLTFEFRCF